MAGIETHHEPWGKRNETAAAAIRRRVATRAETLAAMEPELRAKAVAVSGVEDMRTIEAIREACAKVPEGADWRDARKEVAALLGERVANAGARAELVLRTNCEQARAMAQWRNVQAEIESFPYLMYQTMGDEGVRPSHKALDGAIVRADDPFWKSHYPPWDFGCRCTVVQLDEETAREVAASGEGRMMSRERMQDFKARYGNERADYAFDPSAPVDMTAMGYSDAQMRTMHDILSGEAHTVVNERGERENAWEYLWRTGPQAKDEAELIDAAAEDRAEHVVVRDAETGRVLERASGGDSAVGTEEEWYREGLPGKVRATHIHPGAFSALPSPDDVATALQKRSDMETVVAEWGGKATLRPKPEAKLRRGELARLLAEFQRALDEGRMKEREWIDWLRNHQDALGYKGDAK